MEGGEEALRKDVLFRIGRIQIDEFVAVHDELGECRIPRHGERDDTRGREREGDMRTREQVPALLMVGSCITNAKLQQ